MSTQIKNQKNITFQTAVMLTAKELAGNQKSFSTHDITISMNNKVKDKLLVFKDRNTAYIVNHFEVINIFNELFLFELLPFKYVGFNSKGEQEFSFIYLSTEPPAPKLSSPESFATYNCCSSTASSYCGSKVKNRTTETAIPQPSTDTISMKNVLAAKLRKYISANHSSIYPISMKHIQSRFKGEPYTCRDYSNLCLTIGFRLERDKIKCPSTWRVIYEY